MNYLPLEKDTKTLRKELGVAYWLEDTQVNVKKAKVTLIEDFNLDIDVTNINDEHTWIEVKSEESMDQVHGITGKTYQGQIAYIDAELQNQSAYNAYTNVPPEFANIRMWLINNTPSKTNDFKYMSKWRKIQEKKAWFVLITLDKVYIYTFEDLNKAYCGNVYFNSYTDYLNRPKTQKKKWQRKAAIDLDKATRVYDRAKFEPYFDKADKQIIYWKQCDNIC